MGGDGDEKIKRASGEKHAYAVRLGLALIPLPQHGVAVADLRGAAPLGMSYAGLIHTAKQLAGMLNISPKTVFKLAEGGTHPRLPRWVRRTLRSSSRHRLAAEAETLREFLGNRTEVP